MQPLRNCNAPTIRIGQEILCLPYAGFLIECIANQGINYVYKKKLQQVILKTLSVQVLSPLLFLFVCGSALKKIIIHLFRCCKIYLKNIKKSYPSVCKVLNSPKISTWPR